MDRIGRMGVCALMFWSLAACSKTEATADAGPPVSAPPASVATVAAPSASVSATPIAQALPASERPVAPMKLVLKGPTPAPDKGDFVLDVDIVASEPLVLPLTVRVEVPAGAKLAKGAREEQVQVKQAGTTSKQYTIHIDAPLSGPVVVTAETRDDAGVAGMRATKRYP